MGQRVTGLIFWAMFHHSCSREVVVGSPLSEIRALPESQQNYVALTGNYSVAGFEMRLSRQVALYIISRLPQYWHHQSLHWYFRRKRIYSHRWNRDVSLFTESRGLYIKGPKKLVVTMTTTRKVSHYIITCYLPSGMFVMVSWISFLIPPDVVPGRWGPGILYKGSTNQSMPQDDAPHHNIPGPCQHLQHHHN